MSLYTKIIDLQKLHEAWKKVKSNKPAAGIDEVSYEEFDHGIRENLKQLHLELEEHRYEALPVKLVDIYKGEKKRTISLFSMRDKVLHQAIASELTKLYDAEFSDCTYAYRPGRAALQAIEYLGEEIKRNENAWLLKADIKDFFDSVLQDKLYHTLRVKIHDEDVIELIKECCEVRELQKDGELRKKTRGISQGSGIAPILSNIYLKKFDIEMKQRCSVFLRYSDDIIVFGESREQLESIKAFMKVELEILGLKLNENKTEIKTLEEGVTFLGYEFSKKGKEIPANAEENLEHRLEDIWLSSKENIRIKLQKSAAILEGWEQYYRNEREIRSIQEYVTVVYMVQHKSENILEEIKQKRVQFQNIYKEIGNYLANVWENAGDLSLALYEYEQLYELEELDEVEIADIEEIYHYFKELNKRETEEVWTELMQLYSDNGAYNKAAKIQEFVTKFLQDSVIELFMKK